MTLHALLLFAGALFVAAASPGPGIAAIVARVLGRGRVGAVAFTAGVACGDVVWLAAAVTGLALLAQTFHGLFVAIKYAGVAYLLWLAWKLWTAPVLPPGAVPALPGEGWLRPFLGGLAVTLGNPKVMVFYLALLPQLIPLGTVDGLDFVILAGVTLGVLAVVFGAYIQLALHARRLLASPRAVRLVNRGSGLVMAGAAGAIAARP
jgi:threonine/homoserine/homoserine lactone efflux protein